MKSSIHWFHGLLSTAVETPLILFEYQIQLNMKHKIILEINGVRHKLIKGKLPLDVDVCSKCSIQDVCRGSGLLNMCFTRMPDLRYRKCKPGE